MPAWPKWTPKANAIDYSLVESRIYFLEFHPQIFSLPIHILHHPTHLTPIFRQMLASGNLTVNFPIKHGDFPGRYVSH